VNAPVIWRQVAVLSDAAHAERLSEWFEEAGAVSVTFEDAADQPLFEPKPGETPVWDATRVTALFEADADLDAVHAEMLRQAGDALLGNWREEVLADRAWERVWLEHFRPMRFGARLWIIPSGYPEPEQADAVPIHLDPGLAFGTGTHATTALCLEWLDGHDPAGQVVLDYGCGSGILAVAALALGAAEAHGVDIDPQALTASRDNGAKNGVAERLHLYAPRELPADFRADVLLANILANPLVELAPRLAGQVRPGGWIVLSGLLREQAEKVAAAYRPYFQWEPPAFRDEWVRLSGRRF
jgi:ribosomal protein L11 methyltransferase